MDGTDSKPDIKTDADAGADTNSTEDTVIEDTVDDTAETTTETTQDQTSIVEVDCSSVGADQNFNIAQRAFHPDSVTIQPGEVVKWENEGSGPHTVTSGRPDGSPGQLFGSGELPVGSKYCLRFEEVGTYNLHCRLHAKDGRVAKVVVESR